MHILNLNRPTVAAIGIGQGALDASRRISFVLAGDRTRIGA